MVYAARTFLQLGVPESDADILYGSGFPAPDPILLIEHRGLSILVVTDFERDRAKAFSKADQVWGSFELASQYANLKKIKAPDLSPGGLAIAALHRLGVRQAEIPMHFPVGLSDRLKKSGVKLEVRPTASYPQRLVKKPAEIKAITDVLRHTERALGAAVSMMKNSRIQGTRLMLMGRTLRAEDLRRTINLSLMEADCLAAHTIVAPGDQAVDPHLEGSGPIRPGMPVVIDIFPRSLHSFFFADITRTVVRGKPSAALVHQYLAVLQAQRQALSMIRPGLAVYKVHRAVQQVFERLGYVTGEQNGRLQGFTHSTGHGVGLEIHEPPKIGLVDPAIKFKAGMAVTVEPGLYYLGTGGVRIEDLVVVTKNGIRNLTRFPKKLIV